MGSTIDIHSHAHARAVCYTDLPLGGVDLPDFR